MQEFVCLACGGKQYSSDARKVGEPCIYCQGIVILAEPPTDEAKK